MNIFGLNMAYGINLGVGVLSPDAFTEPRTDRF